MSLVVGFVVIVFHVLFHEMGHYLAAKLFGFNPKFMIKTRMGVWSGIAVKTKTVLPVSLDEVPLVAMKVMICGASGCIGVIPIIVASYLLDNMLLLWYVGPLLLYSMFETIYGATSFLTHAVERLRDESE